MLANRLVKIILLAIIIPIGWSFWPTALGGDTVFLIVHGNSMLPTIQPGSLIIAKERSNYELNEIVAYVLPNPEGGDVNVVHRIIGVEEKGFVIQGDNNPKPDVGYHTNENILGEVIFATPFFGDALTMIRNPLFLVLAVITLVVIQMQHKKNKEKREKLYRLRYGLSKQEIIDQTKNKKPNKQNYSIFWMAIFVNILTYVLSQVSILYQIVPKGDQITGFMFNIIDPYTASTVAFGLYITLILGLYYLTKVYSNKMKISYRSKTKAKSSLKLDSKQQLLIKKEIRPVKLITQSLCAMFIIMSIFNLISFAPDLMRVFRG